METQSNKITYEWDGVLKQYKFDKIVQVLFCKIDQVIPKLRFN